MKYKLNKQIFMLLIVSAVF